MRHETYGPRTNESHKAIEPEVWAIALKWFSTVAEIMQKNAGVEPEPIYNLLEQEQNDADGSV